MPGTKQTDAPPIDESIDFYTDPTPADESPEPEHTLSEWEEIWTQGARARLEEAKREIVARAK